MYSMILKHKISSHMHFNNENNKMKLKSEWKSLRHTANLARTLRLRATIFSHIDRVTASLSFDAFVTELKTRGSHCREFATLQDSLICDKIVVGVIRDSLRERLLRIGNLSLEDAMKLVQTAEATKNMHTNNADHKKLRKTQAILNMPTPSNEMELQRFLGMITYLGKFLSNLSNETAPLRQPLEKDVRQQHEIALNLGTVLEQNHAEEWKPVAFVS